ncbi:MAG: AAA family ATPase [Chthoniobacter sp.]|nr:AAA family ATPase [Chthoniobacter sp.]
MPTSHKTKASKAPLGRYLRRFTLQNARTFRSPVTLDFCHPDGRVAQWTVILGENGTGKTALLQYLAGMLPVQDNELANVPAQTDTDGKLPPFRPLIANEEWFVWHMRNLPQPWGKPMILSATIEVSNPSKSFDETISSEDRIPFGFRIIFGETEEGRSKITLDIKTAAALEFYEQFRMFGYGASRHMAGAASPYLTSESFFGNGGSSPVNTLFHDDHPLISPEQWLLSLDHNVARAAKGESTVAAQRAYDSAKRCLTGSLPGVSEVKVAPYGFMRGQTPLTLLCKTPFSPKPVPFSSLSVGYRTMAAWLTDFVKRMHAAFPDLPEPDNGPAVVLIDEFDLHMHPRWQREAMQVLSKEFPNTQFIVTAHSPIVVQAADGVAKILVLRRQAHGDGTEEIVVDDRPRHASNWSLEQIVEGYYGVSSRSPRYEELMKQRVKLRQKGKRTKTDNRKLTEIEVELERLEPKQENDASERLLADLKKALHEASAN